MPENPLDLLQRQTELLNRMVKLEEEHKTQFDDLLEYQEDHIRALSTISRAANLYFWLTVIGLVVGMGLAIVNIGFFLSILRVLPGIR